MKKVISHPYIIILRHVYDNKQHISEKEEYLHLYEDRVTTSQNVFFLNEIHDMSFKLFSSANGILYLHTNQGVFSYQVCSIPNKFIEAFNSLKSKF